MSAKRKGKGGRTTPKGTRPAAKAPRPADDRSATEADDAAEQWSNVKPAGPKENRTSGPRGGNRDTPPRRAT